MIEGSFADEFAEAGGEGAAGHGDAAGQERDGPGAAGVGVHERERLADLRVGEGAEPTGFAGEKGGMDSGAHGLDEEDFGEAIDDGGGAGLILRGFGGDDLQG